MPTRNPDRDAALRLTELRIRAADAADARELKELEALEEKGLLNAARRGRVKLLQTRRQRVYRSAERVHKRGGVDKAGRMFNRGDGLGYEANRVQAKLNKSAERKVAKLFRSRYSGKIDGVVELQTTARKLARQGDKAGLERLFDRLEKERFQFLAKQKGQVISSRNGSRRASALVQGLFS